MDPTAGSGFEIESARPERVWSVSDPVLFLERIRNNMRNRSASVALVVALGLMVTWSSVCASFRSGYKTAAEEKAASSYGWGHELYEDPLVLVVGSCAVALTPFIVLIPHEEHGLGYLLGDTWGGIRVLLDPTVNYGG